MTGAGATQLNGTAEASSGVRLPAGIAAVLSVLSSSAVVIDSNDRVLRASAAARGFGMVQYQNDQCFRFEFGGRREREVRLHHKSAVLFQYRWRSGKSASRCGVGSDSV